MAGLLERLKGGIQAQAERHRNRPFLEATMAASALVAAADGTVSFSERHRIDQILESLDQLKIFDPHEAVNLFNDILASLAETPDQGREAALKRIARLAEDPEASRLMVRICCAISEADGEFSPPEREQIGIICATLGLSLEDCVA